MLGHCHPCNNDKKYSIGIYVSPNFRFNLKGKTDKVNPVSVQTRFTFLVHNNYSLKVVRKVCTTDLHSIVKFAYNKTVVRQKQLDDKMVEAPWEY